MIFGARRRERRLQHTHDWVRCSVRSGLQPTGALQAEVSAVIALDHPEIADPEASAAEWISSECDDWVAEARTWARPTDYERLHAAFAELRGRGYVVLEGCADHWDARDALQQHPDARGVLWFVPADVWHAIDEPMLEVNLWHPTTANAAAEDALTGEVMSSLTDAGLTAVFDEGRLEVRALWRKLPTALNS